MGCSHYKAASEISRPPMSPQELKRMVDDLAKRFQDFKQPQGKEKEDG